MRRSLRQAARNRFFGVVSTLTDGVARRNSANGMSDFATAKGRVFRAAAPRLFIFLAGVSYPAFVGVVLFKYGFHVDWKSFLLGAAMMIPTSIILAGAASLLIPARLTDDGIHGQSVWGTPSYVRWRDIRAARSFTLLNLRWVRIFSQADDHVTWLALFQSPAAEFRNELERLAPPGSPVLEHLD